MLVEHRYLVYYWASIVRSGCVEHREPSSEDSEKFRMSVEPLSRLLRYALNGGRLREIPRLAADAVTGVS